MQSEDVKIEARRRESARECCKDDARVREAVQILRSDHVTEHCSMRFAPTSFDGSDGANLENHVKQHKRLQEVRLGHRADQRYQHVRETVD